MRFGDWRLDAMRQLESGTRPRDESASPLCPYARPVPLPVLGRPRVGVTRSVGSTGMQLPDSAPLKPGGCVTQGSCSALSPSRASPQIPCNVPELKGESERKLGRPAKQHFT